MATYGIMNPVGSQVREMFDFPLLALDLPYGYADDKFISGMISFKKGIIC